MTDKTRASWLVSGATMALLCVALIAPLGAFAADHPVSGTVKVGGALPAHAVVVTLWAFDPSPDPAIGGWWPSAYDTIAATATGV